MTPPSRSRLISILRAWLPSQSAVRFFTCNGEFIRSKQSVQQSIGLLAVASFSKSVSRPRVLFNWTLTWMWQLYPIKKYDSLKWSLANLNTNSEWISYGRRIHTIEALCTTTFDANSNWCNHRLLLLFMKIFILAIILSHERHVRAGACVTRLDRFCSYICFNIYALAHRLSARCLQKCYSWLLPTFITLFLLSFWLTRNFRVCIQNYLITFIQIPPCFLLRLSSLLN